MSLAIFVSAYSGTVRDQLRNLLVANTTGAPTNGDIQDLWMMFLAQRGHTTGALNDRLRAYLLTYTGATSGTIDDLWGLITTPFSEFEGILDTYTGSYLAYSVARRLRGGYFGPLVKIRRSSDSTLLDIGFTALGELDTVALLAFVGAGDGFIHTLYDQSGNVLHIPSSADANQPALVLSGVLQTQGTNAKPAGVWDGVNDELRLTSLALPAVPTISMWCACTDTSHVAIGHVYKYGTSTMGAGEFRVRAPRNAGVDDAGFNANDATDQTVTTAAVPFAWVGRARANLTSGSESRGFRVNKGTEATGIPAAAADWGAAKAFRLGNEDGNGQRYTGKIGEFILFPTVTHAAGSGLEDDIMAFWGIS